MIEKIPEGSQSLERRGPNMLGSGDLVRIKGEEERTYRTLMIIPQQGKSAKAWVGPPTLTPMDIDLFKLQFPASINDPKYDGCTFIDASLLAKVLDS
ncbi:MAG: hypothetical protein AAB804_01540 [Patescibacteria group bacterium]